MEPFMQAPYDGIVGLGLEGLSVDSAFNFCGRLSQDNSMLSQFALFVPPVDQAAHAEITFGGHNAAHLNSPLTWVPVERPELGYWQVRITSVSIGDQALDICGSSGCRGIIDSSSSRIGVPTESFEQLKK